MRPGWVGKAMGIGVVVRSTLLVLRSSSGVGSCASCVGFCAEIGERSTENVGYTAPFRSSLAGEDAHVFVAAAGQVDEQNCRSCLSSAAILIASATACADSSAGQNPSVRASTESRG